MAQQTKFRSTQKGYSRTEDKQRAAQAIARATAPEDRLTEQTHDGIAQLMAGSTPSNATATVVFSSTNAAATPPLAAAMASLMAKPTISFSARVAIDSDLDGGRYIAAERAVTHVVRSSHAESVHVVTSRQAALDRLLMAIRGSR